MASEFKLDDADFDLEVADVVYGEEVAVPKSRAKMQLCLHAVICAVGVLFIGAMVFTLPFTLMYLPASSDGSSGAVSGSCVCDSTTTDNTTASFTPDGPTFTFSDISDVTIRYASIQWIVASFGEGWAQLDDGVGLTAFWFPNGPEAGEEPSSQVLFPASHWPSDVDVYLLSPDSSFILLGFEKTSIYRHSYYARWEVCSMETYDCQDLVADGDIAARVRLVNWSPGNTLSYVLENNLYVVTDPTDPNASTVAVTSDGSWNHIINGAPDWVYEEEVLSSNSATYWSPDSQKVAFLRFDESAVKEYRFPLYNSPDQYPGQYSYKYPLPGTELSSVSLLVYDIAAGTTTPVDLGDYASPFIALITWADAETLAVKQVDYLQQKQWLFFADAATGESEIKREDHADYWIDVTDTLHFPANLPGVFIDMSPVTQYKHLQMYDLETGDLLLELTQGDYNVESILGYREATSELFFTSRKEAVHDLHIYSIDLSSGDPNASMQRLTPSSGYYSASFSPDCDYFVQYTYGPDVPRSEMVTTASLEVIKVLEANEEVVAYLSSIEMPTREFRTFLSADGETELPGFVMYPPGFDEAETYPVLMNLYGGPDSQLVTSKFQTNFWNLHSYLSTNMGYVVVTVDNRGTCCLGETFTKQTYLQLGVMETEDQLAVAHQLAELPWVQSDHIGVWGWSYGGFLTSRIASAGDSVISAVMSVAPVTDWAFYDSIYTQRYMQWPEVNPEGYEASSVLSRAGGIGETDYLCIHGTGDDNVHFQNSADWVTNMIAEGAAFDVMYYPDKTHSLLGSDTRTDLYNRLTNFITSSFGVTRIDGVGGGYAGFSGASRKEGESHVHHRAVCSLRDGKMPTV